VASFPATKVGCVAPEPPVRPAAVPRLYVETYGCQMNVADTELILGTLGAHGYVRVETPDEADVILLNTCAIREHAEERVLGRLGALAGHKKRPGVRLGVTGCMAQHLREKLLEQAPLVDLLVGPDGYRHLPQLLGDDDADPHLGLRLDVTETYADLPVARTESVRAWVTVMRGCDRFCTFCVVPFVRGRERSLPGPALLDQVRAAADGGAREVVLLGQTVNAYRHDGWDFARLLREVAAVPGIVRVRFTSPHPAEMSEAAIEAMASSPTVAPQLHLPVQSGSDRVLERMARDYTVARYEGLVERLRERVPGIALSTDVIVGFPGEDADDFAATQALVERVRYDSAFLFKYSRREMTRAAKWDETVAEDEKGRRLTALIALQEVISADINRRLVGDTVEVLVEGPARRQEGWMMGKTPQMKTVVFPGAVPVGTLVDVRVESSTAHSLRGARVSSAR
jgi:tRNA-2-methylthio-N6-dimethylallyladenosine synthase